MTCQMFYFVSFSTENDEKCEVLATLVKKTRGPTSREHACVVSEITYCSEFDTFFMPTKNLLNLIKCNMCPNLTVISFLF